MPFFSVIIPTFNRMELTIRCVESVLSQTNTDFEIILVDDGSTDGTEKLGDRWDKRVSFIHQENSGVSAARNRGIEKSGGRYIAFLDSDDLWLPGKLSADMDYIRRNPGIRIFQCGDTWIRDGRRVNPGRRHMKCEGDIFLRSLDLCLISPSAVVIRRDLLDERGMFDEMLPACEDYDLWLRITCSEKVGLIGENLVVRHSGQGDQLSAAYHSMDRFRLYAIIKLLVLNGGELDALYRDRAVDAALKRCDILAHGARKRGNDRMADDMETIEKALRSDICMRRDALTLAERHIHP